MLSVLRTFALFCGVAAFGYASSDDPKTLTIVMDFDGPHSSGSVSAMKQELEGILQGSGLTLDWRIPSEAAHKDFDNLAVVRFRGNCILRPVGYLYDERGPLAYTHTSDGAMLPFSEVDCNTVTGLMRQAMYGRDYKQADLLLGRALGRVLAHELVHILTQSGQHSRDGIAQETLSARQLISETLPLSAEDIVRLREKSRR